MRKHLDFISMIILSLALTSCTARSGDNGAKGEKGDPGKDATAIADSSMPLEKLNVTAATDGQVLTVENGLVVPKTPVAATPSPSPQLVRISDESGNSTVTKLAGFSGSFAILITGNKEIIRFNIIRKEVAQASDNLISSTGDPSSVGQAVCSFQSTDCTGQCLVVPNSYNNSTGSIIVGVKNLVISAPNDLVIVTGNEADNGPVTIKSSYIDGRVCVPMSNKTHQSSIVPAQYTLPDNLNQAEKLSFELM